MKNILSICTFLLAFGTLPLWGQSQDPLNEDQTTVRILEGIIQTLLLSVMENLIIWFILPLFIPRTGSLQIG